jgi:uncharacterized protein YjbI with pentapeptide repeats
VRYAATIFLLVATALLTSARATAGTTLSGASFASQALSGKAGFDGATVSSDVDLSGKTIDHPLSCQNCVFEGKLIANGTTFNGIVDLRGAKLAKTAQFEDATFKRAVLFGSPTSSRHVWFEGGADFGDATFAGAATFEYTKIAGAFFQLTEFDAPATFAHFYVSGNAYRHGGAYFNRSQFQTRADFSDATFSKDAEFSGTAFSGPADFGSAKFLGPATFHRARFDKGATFLYADFPLSPGSKTSFIGVQCGGALDFSFVRIARQVDFSNMVVLGAISFHEPDITTRQGLTFEKLSTTGLDLDVPTAKSAVARADLISVLGMIEASAQARGDLGTANDAHYERRVLESRQDGWFEHALDFVFYRTLAGYFVRPFRPLAALFILAAIATAFHIGRHRWRDPAAPEADKQNRLDRQYRRARRIVSPFGEAYLQTLTMVVPGRGPSADERPARWIEATAYRLLFVCALIGFANSNPTLRQMFDAVR